jgi:HAD superfamily hydrolase (TIGR01484 family)
MSSSLSATASITHATMLVFDLDGTLAPSKSPLEAPMAHVLNGLLVHKKIAIISGGSFAQISSQFLTTFTTALTNKPLHWENLFLFPTSGTSMYAYKDQSWQQMYADHLSASEKSLIIQSLHQAIQETAAQTNYHEPIVATDAIIEDRDTQITFSALGQHAPLEIKQTWDSDQAKRRSIVEALRHKIPQFEIRIGGATSIDITHRGRDKSFGIHQITERLGIALPDMVFMGDALEPGGNDEAVKKTGIITIDVAGPHETLTLLTEALSALANQ